MRRCVIVMLALVLALAAALPAGAQPKVLLDDQALHFDVAPVMEQGRVLVPLRAIFEALGAFVEWDGATQTVRATKGSATILLTVGQATAYVNDTPVVLDVPSMVVSGRTMVPLRFVSESLGAQVDYHSGTQTVTIRSAAPKADDATRARFLERADRLIDLATSRKRVVYDVIDKQYRDAVRDVQQQYKSIKQDYVSHYSSAFEEGRSQYEAGQISWELYQMGVKILQDDMDSHLTNLDSWYKDSIAGLDDWRRDAYQRTDEVYDPWISGLKEARALLEHAPISNPAELEKLFEQLEQNEQRMIAALNESVN